MTVGNVEFGDEVKWTPNDSEGVLSIELRKQHYTLLNYLYHMRYIVTEEQYDKVIHKTIVFWIKRRYDLVLKELRETKEIMYDDICRIDDYESFERKFFSVLMDCLHPYWYDDESFNHTKYNDMYEVLNDLFYVDCTEFYFDGREKC